MNWRIDFSSNSLKFLKRNNLEEIFVIEKIRLTLRKFGGEDRNLDIKKLGGRWKGFYRIRSGKLRIIAEFNFENNRTHIEEVDWRGGAYK